MADTKISALTAIGTATDPAADLLVLVDTSDTTMAPSGTDKSLLPNNLRITTANAATGALARTLKSKLAEFISVVDFGATGDGSTDDTTAVQAAATAVAGTNKTLLLPHGNYKCSALDFTNVRRIICEGIIRSTITSSQTAVLVGTVSSANVDMDDGYIQVRVAHNLGSNATLAGSIGVAIRGAARCTFRLDVQTFETGIDIQPQGGTGTQYVAYCHFLDCHTYGTLYGVRFNGFSSGGAGWINENLFTNLSCRAAGNSLAGSNVGVLMQGDYPSNNNRFVKPALEGWGTPIKIVSGTLNDFRKCRFETAGNIIFGDGTTTYTCANNTVQADYCQTGMQPDWTHSAWAPNFVYGPDLAVWRTVCHVTYDDFIAAAATYYCRSLLNTSSGSRFTGMTLDSAARSFLFAGSDRGICYVPVQKGDILRLTLRWVGSPTGTSAAVSIQARDSAKATLATLSAGDIPYIGTSSSSSFANSTSTTTSARDVSFNNYGLMRFISVNRTDVLFLSFELRTAAAYYHVRIERLDTNLASDDAPSPNWRSVLGVDAISDFIEAPASKTYVLDPYARFPYTIDNFRHDASAGTGTAAIQINGTNVTTLSAVSLSTSGGSASATAARDVVVGDRVTLVLSSVSSLTDLEYSLTRVRTG